MAIELYKKGINIAAHHLQNINVRCPLTREEADILEQCEKTVIMSRAPLLSICIAHSFFLDVERFSLGLSMLESTRIIPAWAKQCNMMDMVLVPSTFNQQTFSESGVNPRKLAVFPLGVDTDVFNSEPTHIDAIMRKRWFPPTINEDTYVFFSNFEWIQRKNPDILLKAFCQAFKPTDNVALILKSYSVGPAFDKTGKVILGKIHSFLEANEFTEHPPIILVPSLLTEDEMAAFYRMIDCYITPSSGEGWSLPIIESMATKKPVIATNWSAYLDYFNSDFGYLIDVEKLIDVPELGTESSPLYRDSQWAQPSLESTINCMKKAYLNQEEACQKGEAGYNNIISNYTWKHSANRLINIICELYNVWDRPQRNVQITIDEPLKVAMVVPSLETTVCGIKEYAKSLKKGIGEKADIRLTRQYSADYQRLSDVHLVNYQFEYTLFKKYMLERELLAIRDKKISITQHSIVKPEYKMNEIITEFADQVIVHSKEMQRYLLRASNKAEVLWIPHGCEDFGIPIEPVTEITMPLKIGTFGLMFPQKGFIELIIAIDVLRKRGLDIQLLMSCAINEKNNMSVDYAQRVQHILRVLGADDFITWEKQFVSKEEITIKLHECDLIVLPYHALYNQLGVSGAVRTAIASIRPTIITDNSFFSDVKDILINVTEAEIATVTRLADILYEVFVNIDLRNSTQKKIEMFVKKNSWAEVGKRHLQVWNKLVGRK